MSWFLRALEALDCVLEGFWTVVIIAGFVWLWLVLICVSL
jgi:hypothetical protein